jgi:hypothetical protein
MTLKFPPLKMTSSSDTEIFTAKNVFPYTDTIHQWDKT